MKTKLLISVISIAVLSACNSTPSDDVIQGTVSSVDLEQVMVDGPAVITLETADDSTVEIRVPSMGRNLCLATDLADPYQIEIGDTVEVNGTMDEEGAIVPCASEEHFLRVITQ